jgi:hypothetical protein
MEHFMPNQYCETFSRENFISKSVSVHGTKYDYSLVEYTNARTKVKIICPVHGVFEQRPDKHMRGKTCLKCSYDERKTKLSKKTEQYINDAISIHGSTYDYSLTEYTNDKSKVKILCKEHGVFEQHAGSHLKGYGCPRCSSNVSQLEQDWLDYIGIPNTKDYRQVKLRIGGDTFKVDGFNQDTNTIYEFYGGYWHGDPRVYCPTDINKKNGESFGVLYERTLKREELLKSQGYILVTMWSYDWLKEKGA